MRDLISATMPIDENLAEAKDSRTLDAIHDRRSVRAFASDPVDEVTVRALLDAAVWAPTAVHIEPWAFAVIQDRALLRAISDQSNALFLNPREAHGALHIAPKPRATDSFDIFYDASTLIVIGARTRGAVDAFLVADCWLAAENLMLAAHAFGLATCVIGSALPALLLPEIKADLGIPHDITPVAPIIVGWSSGPSSPIPPSRKAPDIVTWKRDAP